MWKFLSYWCAFSFCNAFYINEEATRFEHSTRPEDAVYTTLEPHRNFEEPIDFHKGWGQWHTPTRRRPNNTMSFEDFCRKHFPQYTSTPNWDDYGTFAFTLPTNMSHGQILRAAMQWTVHSFEVEEYFREGKRRTWFSAEDTFEKEAWRGWTTTPFYADYINYRPNATWANIDFIQKIDKMGEPTLMDPKELDYMSDDIFKDMNEQEVARKLADA